MEVDLVGDRRHKMTAGGSAAGAPRSEFECHEDLSRLATIRSQAGCLNNGQSISIDFDRICFDVIKPARIVPPLSRRSSRGAGVVVEETAKPRTAPNYPPRPVMEGTGDELVGQSLMLPLVMIVRHELGHGSPNMALAQWNHPI
jgi:hypothetical protein